MQCDACNGPMRISNVQRDGTQRISCKNAHQFGTCSHTRSYELPRVQKLLTEHMTERLLDPDRIKRVAAEYAREMTEQSRANRNARADAEKRLARLEFQIKRLTDAMLADDSQPVAYFTQQIGPLERERVGLAERLSRLQAERNIVELHPERSSTRSAELLEEFNMPP